MQTAQLTLRSPAIGLVIGLWVASAVYLLFANRAQSVLIWSILAAYHLLLMLIVYQLTKPMPATPSEASQSSKTLWLQLAVIGIFILLTPATPIWSVIRAQLESFGEATLRPEIVGGPGNAIANPVQYFVLPFVLLLLLGARPGELGLGRGHRVWPATLVVSAVPAILFIVLLAAGQIPLLTMIRRIVGNALQNGFFEEFLFRGALQTRLNKLMSPLWALVIQAIVFGLWHIEANMQPNGNVVEAIAVCFASQMITGLAYGFFFMRTRNLVTPSFAHVLTNAIGQTLG